MTKTILFESAGQRVKGKGLIGCGNVKYDVEEASCLLTIQEKQGVKNSKLCRTMNGDAVHGKKGEKKL